MSDSLRAFKKRPAEVLLPHLKPGAIIQFCFGGNKGVRRYLARIERIENYHVYFLYRDPTERTLVKHSWAVAGFTDYAWALRDESDWLLQEIGA